MFTVALIARNGGTGKTTLAVQLAASFEAAVVDLAPRPVPPCGAPGAGVARSWARSPPPASRPRSVPHSESTALAAARASDLPLVPLRPGLFDIAALDATARLCALASVPFAVVLNHVPPRGCTADLAAAAVRDFGAEVPPSRIGSRAAFVQCLPRGRSAQEAFPRSKAASEIRALGAWLRERIGDRHA